MVALMGVDVGSSNCKVMLVSLDGTVLATSREPYALRHPRPNWTELDADTWYQVACAAIRTCVTAAAVDPSEIIGIAFDGPAHNAAVLDSNDVPVHPVIHWSDMRSIPQAARLRAEYGERIFATTYTEINPSWTLTQLLWLKENVLERWRRARRILVTKDYVRFRFTGVYSTDRYDAIGTQFYDIERDQWSVDLCALLDVDPAWLPPIQPPLSIAGELQPAAAQDCGLPSGIPIAVSSGDSVVEAFGIGAVQPGQALVKLGTSANVNVVTAHPLPSRQSITYPHVIPDTWFSITATNAGAWTMRWFRDTFCRLEVLQAQQHGHNVYELVDALANGASPGAQGMIFHPYLNGERTPHWDPHLRGDFVGISAQHTEHHFARAILEGVAFSMRDCLDAARDLGQPINEYILIGGGAKSRLWRQIICDVLGQPLIKPVQEDAAFGAALVAGVAVGAFADWQQALAICAPETEVLRPNPSLRALYDDLFAIYRDITCDLAAHSRRLVEISERGPLHED